MNWICSILFKGLLFSEEILDGKGIVRVVDSQDNVVFRASQRDIFRREIAPEPDGVYVTGCSVGINDGVLARPPSENVSVIPCFTHQSIVALATIQNVGARAGPYGVIAASRYQDSVAGIIGQSFVADVP